jgi:hypothetical protein
MAAAVGKTGGSRDSGAEVLRRPYAGVAELRVERTSGPGRVALVREASCDAQRANRGRAAETGAETGFSISFDKKFRTWSKSANFAKFRPKFIFRLFLKILLNIFKLLFLKFSNFRGGRNQ